MLKTFYLSTDCVQSTDNLVDTVYGMIRGSNSVGARDFPLHQIVQTGSGAHLISYSISSGFLSRGRSVRSLMMTTHLHLAPKFGMSRATPPIPLDAFVVQTKRQLTLLRTTCTLKFRRLVLNSVSEKY